MGRDAKDQSSRQWICAVSPRTRALPLGTVESSPDGESGSGFWYALACIGGIGAAVWVGWLLHDTRAETWRTAGGLLEAFGLGLGGWSLYRKLVNAGAATPMSQWLRRNAVAAWSWLRSRLGLEPEREAGTMEGTTLEVKTEVPPGRMVSRPREDADIRKWVEYLDGELEHVKSSQRLLRERAEANRNRIQETRRQLVQADRGVENLVERLTVGAFQWEAVSLFWFLFGVAASTWGRFLPFP